MSPLAAPSERQVLRAAAVLLVFNLLDGVLTLGVIELGLATEANPRMAAPLALGSLPFMAAKLALVSLGVVLLWNHRRQRLASAAILAGAAVYGLIVCHHLESVERIASYITGRGTPFG